MSALTSAQLAQLDWAFHNPTATHRQADFYRLLAHFGEVNGDADPASILWLLGAAEVNENSGSQSAFIRGYNKAQFEVRYGGSLTDAKMDAVSNEIALQVFNEVMSTGSIPIIEVLAQKDAEPAANELFSGDAGGWAGNNLFLALGYSDAFYENIIEAGSSTYDAIAMMKFTAENFSWSNGADAGLQFWNYPAGAATVVAATNALDAFLVAAYGANALMTASQIVASYETILGRVVEADQLHGTEDADLIHGGGGDDTIYGSDGGDLIDGAEGRDVVDYSLVEWGNRFILKDDVQSSAGYVGSVVSTGLFPNDATALFGIEEIRAGDADDEVQLMGLPSTLERIDGGDQGELGDLLSAFYASQGVSFDMESGLLAIGEAALEAVGFERVEGSGHNDFISGNDNSNAIRGGSGADQLFGGGADDFIFFDADDSHVFGGTGRDVAVALGSDGVTVNMAEQGLECVIGCDGDDTITVTAADQPVFAAGGGGADHFILDNLEAQGPRILWGGAGADHFEFQNGGRVSLAVVNIDGLTEEAFSRLTLEDLALGEIDVSWLSAIIINPDTTDRFYSDDGMIGTTSVNLRDWWEIGEDVLDLLLPGSAPVSLDIRTSDVLGGSYSVQGVFRNEVRAIHEITLQYNYYDVTVRSDGGYDLVNTDTYEEYLIRWNEETGQALTGSDEIIEDALMSAEQVFAQWDEYDYGHITSEYWTVQDRSDVPTGPFYVVGGEFAGNVLSANGDLTGSLPNDPGPSPFDWLVAA